MRYRLLLTACLLASVVGCAHAPASRISPVFHRPVMGDVKISQLPTASSLGGSEIVPLVQSGVTVGATATQFKTYIATQLVSGSQYYLQANNGASGFQGIAPSATSGEALISNGSAAYPGFSASLPGVTSVNGVAIPATASTAMTAPTTTTAGLCAESTTTAGLYANQTCGSGSGTVNSGTSGQLAYYAATGTAVSGETSVTAAQLGASSTVLADIQAQTTFTVSGTGCTPSAHTGGPFGGTITLAAGPCTAVTVTINGATGYSAPNGFHCNVGDKTAMAAGNNWIPAWTESASTTTTATLPIPAAAGATDVISFACSYY